MSSIEKDQLRSWIYLAIVFVTSLPISGVFYSFGIFIDIFLKEYGGTNLKAGNNTFYSAVLVTGKLKRAVRKELFMLTTFSQV